MKILSFFLSLLLMASLQAETPWITTTPFFENTPVQFQMPGVPEEEVQGPLHIWKLEAENKTFWVAMKKRMCGHTTDKIKICDLVPFFRYIVPPGWKTKKLTPPVADFKHLLFYDSADSFLHLSFYYDSNIVLLLATKTDDQESPDHQRFIESFVFVK